MKTQGRARSLGRGTRASASIETALGVSVLLLIGATLLGVQRWIRSDAAVPRTAVAMAEYVAREDIPRRNDITALAQWLWTTTLEGRTSEEGVQTPPAVFVVSALRGRAADAPPAVCWSQTVAFGDPADVEPLAERTIVHGREGQPIRQGAGITLIADEIAILAELCTLLAPVPRVDAFVQIACRWHILPATRPGTILAAPATDIMPAGCA